MDVVSYPSHPCTYCSRPTAMWCARCHKAWYCSPEHIHDDWPRHRDECVPVVPGVPEFTNEESSQLEPPADPHHTTVVGIYFEPSEERPRTVNVQCRLPSQGSQNLCPTPILDEFFPDGAMEPIVVTQGLNGDALRFPLQVWYSPTLLDKPGVPPNRAIFHITRGAAEKHWTGPVVVLRYNGTRRQGYSEAGQNVLPSLSSYFLAYK